MLVRKLLLETKNAAKKNTTIPQFIEQTYENLKAKNNKLLEYSWTPIKPLIQ